MDLTAMELTSEPGQVVVHRQVLPWQHDDEVDLHPLPDRVLRAAHGPGGLQVLRRVEEGVQGRDGAGQDLISQQVP